MKAKPVNRHPIQAFQLLNKFYGSSVFFRFLVDVPCCFMAVEEIPIYRYLA
jgi:hypothetical protein